MAIKKMNFEASMARLEEIVRALEDGSEGLDASLKLYEEGIGLARSCAETLDKAEMSIKALQMKPDGSVEAVDFASEGD